MPSNSTSQNSPTPNCYQHLASSGRTDHSVGKNAAAQLIVPCLPASPTWELARDSNGATVPTRDELVQLCSSMLWLRSWWESHQDVVRLLDSKAATEIHDHFIDGAIIARGTARRLGLEVDERRIRNYRWGNSAQSLRFVTPAPAIEGSAA